MVLCTYVMHRPTHNGDIIRYEPIAAIVWKYVSMNEDTFIYETRYLCTGHGRCNILLLYVLTYSSPPPLLPRGLRLSSSSSPPFVVPSFATVIRFYRLTFPRCSSLCALLMKFAFFLQKRRSSMKNNDKLAITIIINRYFSSDYLNY